LLRDLADLAAAPIRLASGLRARTQLAALKDGSCAWIDSEGRLRRSVGPLASAELRRQLAEPPVLASSERGVMEVVACEGWLAYTTIDQAHKRQLHLLHLASGRRFPLGPGLRPCFASPTK
jgi:hypothetical protein